MSQYEVNTKYCHQYFKLYACVAQLGKALGYRSGGHAFEPCHGTYTLCISG